MSTYTRETKNPLTGKYEVAVWMDDYFGHHNYGVKFPDGTIYNPQFTTLKTREPRGDKPLA